MQGLNLHFSFVGADPCVCPMYNVSPDALNVHVNIIPLFPRNIKNPTLQRVGLFSYMGDD